MASLDARPGDRALRAVLAAEGPGAADPLLDRFADATDASREGRAAVLAAVWAGADPAALEDLAHDPLAAVRRSAVVAMVRGDLRPGSEVVRAHALAPLLADPEPVVRADAAAALGRLYQPMAAAALAGRLARAQGAAERTLLAGLLASHPLPGGALEPALSALRPEEGEPAVWLMNALARTAKPDHAGWTTDRLVERLHDPYLEGRTLAALETLARSLNERGSSSAAAEVLSRAALAGHEEWSLVLAGSLALARGDAPVAAEAAQAMVDGVRGREDAEGMIVRARGLMFEGVSRLVLGDEGQAVDSFDAAAWVLAEVRRLPLTRAGMTSATALAASCDVLAALTLLLGDADSRPAAVRAARALELAAEADRFRPTPMGLDGVLGAEPGLDSVALGPLLDGAQARRWMAALERFASLAGPGGGPRVPPSRLGLMLARARADRLGDMDGAVSAYGRVARSLLSVGGEEAVALRARAHLEAARLLVPQGRGMEAAAAADRALAVVAGAAKAYARLGVEVPVSFQVQMARAEAELGTIHADLLEVPDEAYPHFERAQRMDPTPRHRILWAEALAQSGDSLGARRVMGTVAIGRVLAGEAARVMVQLGDEAGAAQYRMRAAPE